jgi:hypothetical protein
LTFKFSEPAYGCRICKTLKPPCCSRGLFRRIR